MKQYLLLPLFLSLVVLCNGQNLAQQVCAAGRHMTEINGAADVMIGGLFEIRTMGDNGFGCGRPAPDLMQIFEAARFSINFLNNANGGGGYLPGVTFGMRAYDTCSSSSQALNALQELFPQSTSSNPYCVQTSQVMTGTVGPLSSTTSLAVAERAAQLPASIVSPRAMSPALSDKYKYPTFLRTVPTNSVFSKAVVSLLEQLQWENFMIIYVDNAYGRSGYHELLQAAYSRGLCVTKVLALNPDNDKEAHKTDIRTLGTSSYPAGVLVASNLDAQIVLEAIQETTNLADTQWILSDIDITSDISQFTRARGSMVVLPRSPAVNEFRDYFTNLENNPSGNTGNPWFEDWFETKYNCLLQGVNTCPQISLNQRRNNFVQSPWAVGTIKAVFAYAETVRQVCQSSGGGACTSLRNMSPSDFHSRLRNLDFTFPSTFPIASLRGERISFDANGDPVVSDFTVYNYNNRGGSFTFQEIGNFVSGTLALTQQPLLYDSNRNSLLPVNPTASCASLGCQNCLLPERSVNFRYTPGDIVIASLIDAHESERSAFTCGAGVESRLASLVAAEWAADQYSTYNPTGLRGISLGSLVADVCPDGAVAGSFITNLLSGNNRLMDQSGSVIFAENIQAFVDQTSMEQAHVVSPVLSHYMIPEVQVGTTSSMMMMMERETPYTSRAIPNDETFYHGIASMLERLGWRYVQIATHSTGMYHSMARTFTRVAGNHGICVVNRQMDLDSGNYENSVRMMRVFSDAPVVVVIAGMEQVRGLLSTISTLGVVGDLQLIAGTDHWARNPDYVQGLESAAAGSIVVDMQMAADAGFNSYLRSLTFDQISVHPFLRELLEVSNGCSVNPSTRGVYSRACDPNTDRFNVYQGKAPYIIQSVRTVADSLDRIITQVCGTSGGICSDFRSANVSQRLNAELMNVAKMNNGYGIMNGDSITDLIFYRYSAGNYARVGRYETENRRIVELDPSRIGNRVTSCVGACLECQYVFALQSGLYTPGDWLVAGVFSVSNPGPENLQPYVCGDVRLTNGPQYTMAMSYALDQLRRGTAPVSVPGVSIGGLIMDHCNNEGRANLMVSNSYSGMLSDMGVVQNNILAWLTDNTAATHEAEELLDPLGVPIVSPSATSDSLMDYPLFHRTVQGDNTVASALVRIIKSLGIPYIQVAHSANDYGRGGLETMMAVTQSEGICITNTVELSGNPANDVSALTSASTHVVVLFMGTADTDALLNAVVNNPVARQELFVLMPEPYTTIVSRVSGQMRYPVISLQLETSVLTGYRNYINSAPLTNPYFAQYYMRVKNCNLPGFSSYPTACPEPLAPITGDSDYNEGNFVLATINAVYTAVDALDRTIRSYCGSSYTSPCTEFLGASDQRTRYNNNLNNVNFVDDGQHSFRLLAREGNVAYDILQSSGSSGYITVGSYAGISPEFSTTIAPSYLGVASNCTSPCLSCVMRGLNFSITPGDIYIGGLFDVHEKSLSPFTCGKIKTLHGYVLQEAFHYALSQVNSKEGQFANILHGTRLGGIGLDACSSQVRGGYIVSNVNNGMFTLAKDGVLVMPSEIDAYIGPYDSSASQYLARIFTDMETPQISFASGSRELSDHQHYPFFYRTVPSDDEQVEAMLKFLDKEDIRYVQVLYEDNANGESTKDYFVEQAARYDICVAQTVDYPDRSVQSAEISNQIVGRLVERPAANTVITFLSSTYVNSVLRAVQRSTRATNKLRFIGSAEWADNSNVIVGVEDEAVDSITLQLDTYDIDGFEGYMSSKTISNSGDTPWFDEYYQEIQNCYLSTTDQRGYERRCPRNPVSVLASPRYQQDPSVVYVMDAVYAAAFGLHETLEDICGEGYTTVCQAYRRSENRRVLLNERLEDVAFQDPVGRNFHFVDRSGTADFRINTIQSGPISGANYERIGTYNTTSGEVTVDASYATVWNSNCERQDACAECPAIRDNSVRHVFYRGSNNMGPEAPTVVAFFDIHKQGIDPYRCGEINPMGFQQMLSFFYSLERVSNADYRNVRVLVIDTCSNSLRVDQDLYGLLVRGDTICNYMDIEHPVSLSNLAAVVTVGEENTQAAGRVLEYMGVTYVSPNAITPHLDHNAHLVRTIAPISATMRAIVNMLGRAGWESVIREDEEYAHYAWQTFDSYASMHSSVCRGSSMTISEGDENSDVANLLRQLQGGTDSRAVVLIGSSAFVRRVLEQAARIEVIDDFVWVIGGEWKVSENFFSHLDIPSGATVKVVSIERRTARVNTFASYVSDFTREAVTRPGTEFSVPVDWFDEFYQTVHDCSLDDSITNRPIMMDKAPCVNASTRFSESSVPQDMYVLNTVAAVYAVGDGLRRHCPSAASCDFSGTGRADLQRDILDTEWNMLVSSSGSSFSSNQIDMTLNFNDTHRWWDQGHVITLWELTRPDDHVMVERQPLFSGVFAPPHGPSALELQEMLTSIDLTSECTESAEVSAMVSEGYTPSNHRNYYYYDSDDPYDRQYKWPIWAIAVCACTCAGIIMTAILFLILLIAYPVRSGTSVLGYLVIIGIICIYVMNFAFFFHASDVVCGLRRFMMGVVYMIALAPLLIKAIDDWRFGHVDYANERYSGISSTFALILFALGLVLIQCIVPIIWLILEHPTASWLPYPDDRHDNWWCDPADDYDLGLVLSFCYVVFILFVTGIFAALSFDSSRNNYESRWILFGCVATAGCFLVWMVVTTNAGPEFRDPAVAIANFVNATLLCIVYPLRKTILMCRAMSDKEKDPMVNGGPYDNYSNSYGNPTFELGDYDNQYVDSKPEDL